MKNKRIDVYLIIQVLLFLGAIYFFIAHAMDLNSNFLHRESFDNMMNFVYCLALSFLPIVVKLFKIKFTNTLKIYYILAIITHFVFGGTFHGYKTKYFSFIVHFTNSFLMGVVCYGIILRNVKTQGKLFMFISTTAAVMLIGGLWELFEYSYDLIFDGNMQKFLNTRTLEPYVGRRAIYDTMIDILMDFMGGIGAGLLSGYIKIRKKSLYAYFELKSAKYRPAMFGSVSYCDYSSNASQKKLEASDKNQDKSVNDLNKNQEETNKDS